MMSFEVIRLCSAYLAGFRFQGFVYLYPGAVFLWMQELIGTLWGYFQDTGQDRRAVSCCPYHVYQDFSTHKTPSQNSFGRHASGNMTAIKEVSALKGLEPPKA
jgi:hypothetical protein